MLRARGVEPFLPQLHAVEIHGPQVCLGVVSAAHHGARVLVGTVEIGHASQETLAPVAVIVAPGTISARAPAGEAAVRVVPYCVHGPPALSVENGQELRPVEYVAAGVAVVCQVVGGPYALVVGCLGHIAARAVGGAGAGLAYQFGPAVAVEVEKHRLRIVRTGPYVFAQVNAPQALRGRLVGRSGLYVVAVVVDVAGKPACGIVLGIRRSPLYEQFILAVSVDVGHASLLRIVGVAVRTVVFGVMETAALRALKPHSLVLLAPCCGRL